MPFYASFDDDSHVNKIPLFWQCNNMNWIDFKKKIQQHKFQAKGQTPIHNTYGKGKEPNIHIFYQSLNFMTVNDIFLTERYL